MVAEPDSVMLLPNGGWDERILVCRYNLPYRELFLPMQVFIVVTERYVVLVDTLINPATARALLDLATPYLGERQLLVVNTHADFDHAWGNQIFAGSDAIYRAPVIGSQRCAERMRSEEAQGTLATLQREDPERFAGVRIVPPTLIFADSLVIDGGDLSLELFATPGHTHDHCSIFIKEIGTLLVGDAAELPVPFIYGDVQEHMASLARLTALQPKVTLYCHVSPPAGPEVLEHNLAYFARLERYCRRALERGLPLPLQPDADVESLIGLPYDAVVPPQSSFPREFYQPGHAQAISAILTSFSSRA